MVYILAVLTIVLWLGIIYPEISSFGKERRERRVNQSLDYERQIRVNIQMREQLNSYENKNYFIYNFHRKIK